MSQTPDPYDSSPASHTTVTLLNIRDALPVLRADLREQGPCYAWAYLISFDFCTSLLSPHMEHSQFYLIADHKQRPVVSRLAERYKYFHGYTWSYNRTMHEKTFIFPELAVVWVGSQNLTQGSYTLSLNRSARVVSKHLCDALAAEWWNASRRARPVLPSQNILT